MKLLTGVGQGHFLQPWSRNAEAKEKDVVPTPSCGHGPANVSYVMVSGTTPGEEAHPLVPVSVGSATVTSARHPSWSWRPEPMWCGLGGHSSLLHMGLLVSRVVGREPRCLFPL